MKTKLIVLFALVTTSLFAHMGVDLGPNGGRLLEFSKNESLHGEVISKDGKFHISLLDKDLKPVVISSQTLTAVSGDRSNPEKLTVEVKDNRFLLPMLKGEEYIIILQVRSDAKAKPFTARLPYNAHNCDACDSPEWLCKCKPHKH